MLASLYRGVSRSKLWRGQNRSAVSKICFSLTYYALIIANIICVTNRWY